MRGNVFDSEAIKYVPVFKGDVKACVCFYYKGFCFNNCGLNDIYANSLSKVGGQFHTCQLNYRKD